MTRIWIENNELDINKGLSNQITYAIDDLINIDSKATAFSKTIVLPGSTNNNNLLGNIFEFNQANFTDDTAPNVGYNFNAAKSAQCRIEVNGLTIIKGTFRLLEIIVDGGNVEYEVAVFGELGGFVSKLGALKLSDLDFSAYDHTYDVSGIVNSWSNASGGTGYYYPLIDYGTYGLNSKTNWKATTFRPALFVKEYLEKIVSNAGYTMEFPLANTPRFRSLIVPYNKKILTANNTTLLELQSLTNTIDDVTNALIDFTGGTNTLGSFTTGSYTQFTYNGTLSAQTKLTAIVTIESYTAWTDTIIIQLRKNGAVIKEFFVSANGEYDLSYATYNFNVGDTIDLRVSSIILGETIQFSAYMKVESLIAQPTPLYPNGIDMVRMNDTIPANILQKDFVASILKLFNLYIDENRFDEKHLIIKPYVDYYTDTIEDWSDKVDRSKPIKIKPMSELNSRLYEFKYKSDNDYYNDLYRKRYNVGYGDRIFDSTYEFASDTKSLELVFAATPLVKYSTNNKVYSTIFKLTNNIEETQDSVIRILQAKVKGATTWSIYDVDTFNNATNILWTGTSYGYAGNVDDPVNVGNTLNFGANREEFFTFTTGGFDVNQFNVYYSAYLAEITDKDSRLLTCFVKLTDVDVYNLDFAKYYYIDGGLYRLMKLIDYTPQENNTTQAEFLRVINKFY